MILFANNKTASWLSAKTAAERHLVLSIAQKAAGDIRSQFKARHAAIQQYRAAQLQKEEEEIRKKRERERKEAQWPIGYGGGLRIKRSSVRIRPWPLH